MRTWVFNRISALDLPDDMTVHSSGSADNPAPPFIIVSMGIEQNVLGMPSSAGTFEAPFDVWVHDKPGSMVRNIDAVATLLKDELPKTAPDVAGGVSVYQCHWEETANDAYDDHYGTNTRRVSFRLMCVKPVGS